MRYYLYLYAIRVMPIIEITKNMVILVFLLKKQGQIRFKKPHFAPIICPLFNLNSELIQLESYLTLH